MPDMNPALPPHVRLFVLAAPIWAIRPAEAGFDAVKHFFEVTLGPTARAGTNPARPPALACRFEVSLQSGEIHIDEIWENPAGGAWAPVTTVVDPDPDSFYFVRGGDGVTWRGGTSQPPSSQPTNSLALVHVGSGYLKLFFELLEAPDRRGWTVAVPDDPFFGIP